MQIIATIRRVTKPYAGCWGLLLGLVLVSGCPGVTVAALFTGLGDLPGGTFPSSATGVSADGSVVVGSGKSVSGPEAFRWENGVMTPLGDLPEGIFFSEANGISANGSVIVGESISDSGPEAFRWELGVMTGLGDLSGGFFFSIALGVSADGSVVVGVSNSGDFEAFRRESGVMSGLGHLPGGGPPESWTNGASADGAVVVGGSTSAPFFTEAFRWESGMMTGLGVLLGGDFSSANAVSADGVVVVGDSSSASGKEAFVWDEFHGMRSLQDELTDAGLDLTGWSLTQATGVSADGLVLVGNGINPNGNQEGWRVDVRGLPGFVPEPGTLTIFAIGSWALLGRRRVSRLEP